VLGAAAVWLVLGVLVALTAGRGGTAGEVPTSTSTAVRPGPVPLPPIGVALVLMALALAVAGYVMRLAGVHGRLADALSVEVAFSVPRLFCAGLFAIAAGAAVAGAGVRPSRRSWWLAVALVGTGGSVATAVHAHELELASAVLGTAAALVVSGLLATGVVGGLWYLSRHERRDRRRVLSALSLYAVATVGLSALSSEIAGDYGSGSGWAAAAVLVEHAAEALGAVAFLVAVMIGVAPRWVLPASWPLRRRADVDGRSGSRVSAASRAAPRPRTRRRSRRGSRYAGTPTSAGPAGR
jgi:hypothetical protein